MLLISSLVFFCIFLLYLYYTATDTRMKKLVLLLPLLLPLLLTAQNVRLSGNVKDTSSSKGLPNALLMALKFKDSSLVAFTRTDEKGFFKPITIPRDTYLVVISHPFFADKIYVFDVSEKDTALKFSNVRLPPKSQDLAEIEILGYRDKMYYKGDTLVFTADSFKTMQNATVEDLLKKLPGFRIDAQGKITVQGKKVDQVLVDGDEFFGTDPTIATRNLNAASIANVQVYEKKGDGAGESSEDVLKILNLQMKEDAKKGYFGKVSGASDFQNFYEGEALANRFKGNQKVSVFGLSANTPKQAFGQDDAWKYGLTNENDWSFDEETGSWTSNQSAGTGIPKTMKAGFYFNDKFGKNLKINADYTYNQNSLEQGSETNTQNFLQDTSFSTARVLGTIRNSDNHAFNMNVRQKLDSLTELFIVPKLKYARSSVTRSQQDQFIAADGNMTRETLTDNSASNENSDANLLLKVVRNFKKKDRVLSLGYQPSLVKSEMQSDLNFLYRSFRPSAPDSSVKQQRSQLNEKNDQNFTVSYTEPLTKKFKISLNYLFANSVSANTRNTYDFAGTAYDIFNPGLSNSFQNTRQTNRAGINFIYDVKKYRVTLGTQARSVMQQNFNRSSGKRLSQNQEVLLPGANFRWRINDGTNFDVNYGTSSQLPDLQKMQPVTDNSDPNQLSIGTPSLLPNFNQNMSVNYNFYKGISDVHLWSGMYINSTKNDFSNLITYDSIGRSVSQLINVNGNASASLYFGGGFPVFKKFLKIYYQFQSNTSKQVSYINGKQNITNNLNLSPSLTFEKSAEKIEARIAGGYNYNVPRSTISSLANQPYYTYDIAVDFTIKLPHHFFISSDAKYTNNGNRTPGYNLNFLIWNASAGRAFLKKENLILSGHAFDLLNQNISNQRTIGSNQIIDEKTTIIKRYFLVKLTYKFNSSKTADDEDED